MRSEFWKIFRLTKSINLNIHFPGPGLGIRIVGKLQADRIRILQEADDIL